MALDCKLLRQFKSMFCPPKMAKLTFFGGFIFLFIYNFKNLQISHLVKLVSTKEGCSNVIYLFIFLFLAKFA